MQTLPLPLLRGLYAHGYFSDWGGGKVTTVTDYSDQIVHYPSLDALLDTLTEPTRLIGEATFESFDLQRQHAVLGRAKQAGHVWLATPNRKTGEHRKSLGYEDKTDEIDVLVLRDLALMKPECLKVAKPRLTEGSEYVTRVQAANRELMILRRTMRVVEKPRTKLGFATVSAKDDYADGLSNTCPPTATCPIRCVFAWETARSTASRYSLL